ncbi:MULTISPECIES: small-conductance mechanosensitive channel MscS [Sodalis]|jgi:small conductance mechanosensitive channel|uniref:Small-conductance mechanosensitive channel n=1 Tax=Sodalis ligni TaxID=2697027 RepID=A0A4V2Q2Y0_9GAMM|nr:small-conductance mechanosensitive channel MscS [Sodalis ligni]TCL04598.1 small conductance mechanosensitive channel [Sodalis ligni]
MEDLNVVDKIDHAGNWLVNNEQLLLSYAVNIVAALVILFAGILIARVISRTINQLMRSRHIDITVADFLSSIIRYGVIIFTVIAALGRVGVQTASVIAVIGAAGLAVGLALQGSLANFAAGVLLVTFRPFRAGEYVDFGGTAGTVLIVQIFSTTLRTYDGLMIVVPNGKILAGNITNFSREPNRLVNLTISVSYDADINTVKSVITDIIKADSRVLKNMGITVGLNNLGASSLDFMVRAWVKSGDLQNVTFDWLERFKHAFDERQIGIPYPQMDVHMYRTPKPQTAANEDESKKPAPAAEGPTAG